MASSENESNREDRATGEEAQLEDYLLQAGANMERALRIAVEREPIAAMAVGAGIGFVLGRGLPKGITALLLGTGTRVGMHWLTQELTRAGGAEGGADAPGEDD